MQGTTGLGARLRRLVHELDGAVQATYDALQVDFRPRFYPIVRILQRSPSLGIVSLAEACGVSQPAMTQTIQEMRRAGLIVSVESGDRRTRMIALSDHGRTIAEMLEPTWNAIERAARELDDELPHSLSKVLDDAIKALGTASFSERIARQRT